MDEKWKTTPTITVRSMKFEVTGCSRDHAEKRADDIVRQHQFDVFSEVWEKREGEPVFVVTMVNPRVPGEA